MYATHDAFRRDLVRLRETADDGRMHTPSVQAEWGRPGRLSANTTPHGHRDCGDDARRRQGCA